MIRGDSHVNDWAEIAVDYLDGRVDHDTRIAVEAHLSACPECAAQLRRQQYVVSFLQDTALDDPPADLEYRSIGQIIFPAPGDEPVFKAADERRTYRTPRWYRELRHWIPAAVAIIALLSAVVAYGVVRSGGSEGSFTTTTAGSAITAAAATTAAPSATEMSDTLAGAISSTATTAAASGAPTTTTTAMPAGTVRSTGESAKLATTADPKAMVKALQTADAPTFVAFQAKADAAAMYDTTVAPSNTTDTTVAGPTDTGVPTTTDTTAAGANVTVTSAPGPVSSDAASTLLDQIQEFTGLQPVDQSLWLGGPTFAVYLPRKDASKLVDMVRSLSAGMGITVTVGGEPPAAMQENSSRLLEQKATFPVLEAHRAVQPATWGYNFTTSTIVPPDQAPQYEGILPDAEHVLVIMWIAQ
jgi:anti-sigma factor RsiW